MVPDWISEKAWSKGNWEQRTGLGGAKTAVASSGDGATKYGRNNPYNTQWFF